MPKSVFCLPPVCTFSPYINFDAAACTSGLKNSNEQSVRTQKIHCSVVASSSDGKGISLQHNQSNSILLGLTGDQEIENEIQYQDSVLLKLRQQGLQNSAHTLR